MTSKKVPKSSNDKFCKIYDDICSTNNNNQCIEPVTEIQNTSIEVTMTTKKVPKSSNLFFCEKCNFTCSRESQYKRHLSTSKHQNTSNTSISIQKSAVFKCECGNHYKHRQSLYNHKNKCNFLLESKNHSSEPSPPQQSANSNTDNSELVEKMFTMFTQMMTHNQDFMQNVIGKDLSVLHGQNLKLWQEKNPKYEKVEKLQIELTNIISELYTNILEERKPINKFINTLTNSTYLNDDMKEQYKKNDSLSPTL